MNSIIFLNLFGPSKLVRRQCSTKKSNRIKLLNSTKKSLFGPVIKSKEKKNLKSNDNITHETSYSSEMFWVLGSNWNDIIVNKVRKPNELNGRSFTINKSNSNQPNESKEKNSDSNENNQTIYKRKILFSEDELKNLKMYPLVTEISAATAQQDLSIRSIPSVGKILQCTMPEAARTALMNWKLAKILELGEQGFADLQRLNLNTGYAFHHSLQHYFSTNEIPLTTSPVHKLWESVSGVLDTFNASPVLVEKPILHPTLKYKGICDCVSNVDNQLTLIEWKKSGRSKPTLDSTYDAPLQLCAYLGALHSMPDYRGRIKQGMVVVAYEDGKQADVYKLNEIMLRKYWRSWLERLHEFWIRTRDDTLLEPI